jgi:Zn-dependent peptidase ImmA (M78 family)
MMLNDMQTSSGNREKAMSLLKMAKVKEAPVNVHEIAKLLGFTIIETEFPNSYSGEIFIEGNVKSIGVNKNHTKNRQRFTVAHELGHYLNGHQYFDEEGKMLEDTEFDFNNPLHKQEKEANLFASELLIPKEFLVKDLEKLGLDIKKLTEKYQVSEQAMWIRLTSLRLAEKFTKG